MCAVRDAVRRLADRESNVLVIGETGTGKELVARALHESGIRSHKPFVAVNCAAIPAESMEAELFGHVSESFPGAPRDRIGVFRKACAGTLFLDEIEGLGLRLRCKVLRALEERTITPVGGSPVGVEARIILTMQREPARHAENAGHGGHYFSNLDADTIRLPALRERLADIVPLAEHFLSNAGSGKRLTADAAATLIRHRWPGNVRELENTMDRATIIVRGPVIDSSDLVMHERRKPSNPEFVAWPDEDLPTAVQRLEDLLIRRALGKCDGNRAEAARILNINRQQLYTKMKRLGISGLGARRSDLPIHGPRG